MYFFIERVFGFDIFWYILFIVLLFWRNLNYEIYCFFFIIVNLLVWKLWFVEEGGRGGGERKREVKEDLFMKSYIFLVLVYLVFKILVFDKIYFNVLF